MPRHQPEGTRLISRDDSKPGPYTYGAIKREPFLPAPRKYLWAKRDFVLISVALVTALVIVAVTLSLGLPRITANRSRHLNPTISPSPSAPLPPLQQVASGTESNGVPPIGKYIESLIRSNAGFSFQISPF